MSLESVLLAWANSPEGKATITQEIGAGLAAGKSFDGFSMADVEAAAQSLNKAIHNNVPEQIQGSYSASVNVIQNGTDFTLEVDIDEGPLYRPSLEPEYYDGVYNIFGLFIKGYSFSAGARIPSGIWHGKKTMALTHREADPFVRRAVDAWVAGQGKKFDIKNVTISGTYE